MLKSYIIIYLLVSQAFGWQLIHIFYQIYIIQEAFFLVFNIFSSFIAFLQAIFLYLLNAIVTYGFVFSPHPLLTGSNSLEKFV